MTHSSRNQPCKQTNLAVFKVVLHLKLEHLWRITALLNSCLLCTSSSSSSFFFLPSPKVPKALIRNCAVKAASFYLCSRCQHRISRDDRPNTLFARVYCSLWHISRFTTEFALRKFFALLKYRKPAAWPPWTQGSQVSLLLSLQTPG